MNRDKLMHTVRRRSDRKPGALGRLLPAIRSRYPIHDLTTLRRIYTPGVASACLEIAAEPSLPVNIPLSAIRL